MDIHWIEIWVVSGTQLLILLWWHSALLLDTEEHKSVAPCPPVGNFFTVVPNICGPSFHPSGTQNFAVVPRFLANLWTSVFIYCYGGLHNFSLDVRALFMSV